MNSYLNYTLPRRERDLCKSAFLALGQQRFLHLVLMPSFPMSRLFVNLILASAVGHEKIVTIDFVAVCYVNLCESEFYNSISLFYS